MQQFLELRVQKGDSLSDDVIVLGLVDREREQSLAGMYQLAIISGDRFSKMTVSGNLALLLFCHHQSAIVLQYRDSETRTKATILIRVFVVSAAG